jgi:sirohydrochlorin cobaltochelatase
MRSSDGLILYVHGARDPRWAEPFERLRDKLAARHAGPVTLAFLEHGTPDLAGAAQRLAAEGVERLRVVPMFFGRGGHLREDFPRQLQAARSRAPTVEFDVTEAAGESDAVLEALAAFALEAPASLLDNLE